MTSGLNAIEFGAPVVGDEAPVVGGEPPRVGNDAPLIGDEALRVCDEASLVGDETPMVEEGAKQTEFANSVPSGLRRGVAFLQSDLRPLVDYEARVKTVIAITARAKRTKRRSTACALRVA